MKTKLFVSAAFLVTMGASAQTLQDAINKTENERYEAAAADFRALIQKEAAKGENYFFFGENYFKNNDLDSALLWYKKGAEVNATSPLNYVGIGKVYLWQGNEGEANTNLFKAKTLGAKNAITMFKLGEAYTNAPKLKNLPEAINLINAGIKLDSKNPEGYILLGDALLEQNPTEGGPAITQYEKAYGLDKKSVKAILRIGKLYKRGRSYDLALNKYKEAEAIDAMFAPAYREKAELYHLAGQHSKAIENYKKYLELNNSLSARDRYASFLFLNKQYSEAVTEIEEIQKKDANSPYLYRILSYAYYEMGDKTDKEAYNKGLNALNTFFSKTEGKNFKYILDDYKYKGLLLSKTGKDSLGVIEIEKAIQMDAENSGDLYGEMAKIHVKAKKWMKAVEAYDKKAQMSKNGLTGQDNFDLGRAYFFMGGNVMKEASALKDAAAKSAKEGEAKALFVKSDTAFARLTKASPTFPAGYFWRGKANVQLDPKNETWAAKPHYEKGLELVKPEERGNASFKNNVIEACEYLGYHFLKNNDNAKAKEYFTIINTLDPNNKKAKDFFASPAGK